MKVFSVRLSVKLNEELEKICEELERSKTYIITKALEGYLENTELERGLVSELAEIKGGGDDK